MELKLSFNRIKYVGPRALRDNINLWNVDFSYNKIKYIASDVFRPSPSKDFENFT